MGEFTATCQLRPSNVQEMHACRRGGGCPDIEVRMGRPSRRPTKDRDAIVATRIAGSIDKFFAGLLYVGRSDCCTGYGQRWQALTSVEADAERETVTTPTVHPADGNVYRHRDSVPGVEGAPAADDNCSSNQKWRADIHRRSRNIRRGPRDLLPWPMPKPLRRCRRS